MLRGALFFWWVRFLSRPRWSEGPRLSGRAFLVGFRTDFVTSVWVSDVFAGVLAIACLRPAGARKPQGAPSAPLRTSMVLYALVQAVGCHASFFAHTDNKSRLECHICIVLHVPAVSAEWQYVSSLCVTYGIVFGCRSLLTRAPLGYFYNAPHWGGGYFEPPLWSPKLLGRF